METPESGFAAWLDAERKAIDAELAVAHLGETTDVPEANALRLAAVELRNGADALFTELYTQSGARKERG